MMRTISLPDEVIEKAEVAARRQGLSLEAWMERAVASASESGRVEFPVFTSKNPGSLHLTNEDIRRLEEEDDLRMLGRLV